MSQKKILMPTKNAESWKQFLAKPEKHWKDGYSAKSAAKSWEKNADVPKEILKALNKSDSFAKAELILAIPEFKVPLPGSNTADSQNDILAILSTENNLIVATVEAKCLEPFDDLIEDWIKDSSDGKKERLSYILNEIGFPQIENGKYRYQLFHRLASAVIMAKKFHAKHALMIIQSFENDDNQNHYGDFSDFVEAYGKVPSKETPITLTQIEDLTISTIWVNSKI
jgi:hypothetical protein